MCININNTIALGVMSGTSLDGVDLALCDFNCKNTKWHYKILKTATIPYSTEWKKLLSEAPQLNGRELILLNNKYAELLSELICSFLNNENKQPELIASHGHTVFHMPEKNMTYQIGNGNVISAKTLIPVVWDFRAKDVALGGQGAPLVPIGDELLFNNFDYCLNLGGFSNISYKKDLHRIAFDICPANIALNYLSSNIGYSYDENGNIASSGKINKKLLNELNNINYYSLLHPKSLGKEWFDNYFKPILDSSNTNVENKLRTVCLHIAQQISAILPNDSSKTVLTTGGGALNSFLINEIQSITKSKIIIPDSQLINFKEAIIFAFLGILKINNINNCMASVTGALRDSSSGVVC